MSTRDIIEMLPKLSAAERQEVRRCLAGLDGDEWIAEAELTESEKALLGERLAEYELDPEAGSTWNEVEARIRSRLAS